MSNLTRIGVVVLAAAGACWTPSVGAAAGDTYGPTGPNDTLWSIANRLRPEGATVEQTMLALARLHPDSFVGPRRNLVMAGATLRAPTLAEAQAVTAARAAGIVADPEANWAEVLGPAVVEGSDVAPPAPATLAPARPADERASSWQIRAEDAELRVAELERANADLQSQLDEQAAVATRAERRVAQLEAQVARKPRSTSPFARRDEPDPMLYWSGLGGAGFVLFLVGLLMGRRRGRPRNVKGVAGKPRVSPRPAADFAAAEALGEADSEVVGPVRVAGSVGTRPPNPAPPPQPAHNQRADVGRAPFGGAAAPAREPPAPTLPAAPATSAPATAPRGVADAGSLPATGSAGFDNADTAAAVGGDTGTPVPRPRDVDATAAAASPPDAERAPAAAYATTTKLNLARAYVDLNDRENARAVCLEVLREGNDAEREVARALLQRLNEPAR